MGCCLCFTGFENLGYLLIFSKILMNGIGYKIGDEEGCSLGGSVGAEYCVFTLGGCKTSYNLRAGAGIMVISAGWRFSF